jgi:hypothetical protein
VLLSWLNYFPLFFMKIAQVPEVFLAERAMYVVSIFYISSAILNMSHLRSLALLASAVCAFGSAVSNLPV